MPTELSLVGSRPFSSASGISDSGKPETSPDPKPPKRYRATKADWEHMHRHFHGHGCWLCGSRTWELHHILPRSQGGDDVTQNLMPVCQKCHSLLHAADPNAMHRLRVMLHAGHESYLRFKKGENWRGWLDRRYPRLAA